MMEIAWFVCHWLNPVEAGVRLLENLGDTLAGPFMAAGLAARLFEDSKQFFDFARQFDRVDRKEQYRKRLQYVEENGILTVQAHFWKLESECRTMIEKSLFNPVAK
jgi:hypothetical protein